MIRRMFGAPRVFQLGALLVGLLAAGCGRPFAPATPPGFVDLGEERYDEDEYRATTADGLVLGIRAFENDPEAELPFLVRALENRMRAGGGYALLEKKEVRGRTGLVGSQLTFGHDQNDQPHLYVVTLFVTPDYVFLLEAGGTKEQMEAAKEQVDWSIANFVPD